MSLQNILNEYAAVKSEFQEKIKIQLFEEFKQFFVDHPEVKTVQWLQYVPFFNDGETCEFSVQCIYASNALPEQLSDWGEVEDEDDTLWSEEIYTSDKYPLLNLLNSSEMEDMLESTFGSHAKVVVTAAGIESEEYDSHD